MAKLGLIGATGNIGRKVLEEALARGHSVNGTTRIRGNLPPRNRLTVAEVSTADVEKLGAVLSGLDHIIVSVKWDINDVDKVISAIRGSGVKKALFVVGAGSLLRADGRRHFEHMPVPPPSSLPAILALERIREIEDFNWTAISPPASIKPGQRTGQFRYDTDLMVVGENDSGFISQEDFAVAIMDEVENPKYTKQRFTVGY